ncbi:hypothetical protein [Pseudomonas palleroniana]|uniref:hypothetical protein n=1 Tax=Pseudomonas palleroniana TaxID=191390 RepID=UPI0018E685FC|nr:hypothetical protein [Pseudomonas palleroniana]MBI6911365.1 hypothetical protein [Pseudomonas palleroniana]NCE85591.1 hypothetical protein [Pseudomonas sp. Q1]
MSAATASTFQVFFRRGFKHLLEHWTPHAPADEPPCAAHGRVDLDQGSSSTLELGEGSDQPHVQDQFAA